MPSLEISDTDFDADAKIKEYDQTAVHFNLKRSFVADDTWYTICLPFNVAQQQLVEVFGGEKVELRTFDHMEDGTVMYFKPVYDLEAGIPYLIKPNKNLDSLLFENVKIDMAAHPDLQVGADGYFMQGTYQATELNPDGTNLFLGDNNPINDGFCIITQNLIYSFFWNDEIHSCTLHFVIIFRRSEECIVVTRRVYR